MEIVQTFANGFTLSVDESGWESGYRLSHGEKSTGEGMYEDIFYLDGMVAVSPYYTDEDNWILVSTEEAVKLIAIT